MSTTAVSAAAAEVPATALYDNLKIELEHAGLRGSSPETDPFTHTLYPVYLVRSPSLIYSIYLYFRSFRASII